MRWRWLLLGAAACVAGLGGLLGFQIIGAIIMNQFETTAFEVDGDTLYMNGEINAKTLDQFEAVIATHPGIATLVECDVPGSFDDDTMIPLSYRVRELGIATHLTATSEIASGGVDLFLAGVTRTMAPGARLGVHSWSDGRRDAVEYPRDAPEHEANRAYVEAMLGDDGFYWFTIEAAPAAKIHWMSDAELSRYDVLTAPPAPAPEYDCDGRFGAR